MDVAAALARVERIRAIAGDDEAAHSEEDDFRADVLRAIADGTCENPVEIAYIALSTSEIEFARWCA